LTDTTWGLLGPEKLASERRTRTLELGAAVRTFNDLAFPGLGGVWFGKQIFLAALGVAVAERVRDSGRQASNVEVANAIEALACWLALDSNGWKSDPRLRGARKLRRKIKLAFSKVRRRGFYVTAPMRQVTIQPLKEFGLVDSSRERFNSFQSNTIGSEFVDLVCHELKPYRRSVVDHLTHWVGGEIGKVQTPTLCAALSPLEPLPQIASDFLRHRIVSGGDGDANRRQNSFAWANRLKRKGATPPDWDDKPPMLDEHHWNDLRAGAKFFLARDSAISLLNQVEVEVGNSSQRKLNLDKQLPSVIVEACQELRKVAVAFLDLEYDPTTDTAATRFSRECSGDSNVQIIENLLIRDGHVLRQSGRSVSPGVAFRGHLSREVHIARSDEEDGEETETSTEVSFPKGTSNRAYRMFLLNLDLDGELDERLNAPEDNGGEE
jgi:hypothetical protein